MRDFFNWIGVKRIMLFVLEYHIGPDRDQHPSEYLLQKLIRKADSDLGADQSACDESQTDIGRDRQVDVAVLVIGPRRQDSDGRDEQRKCGPLRLELSQAKEVNERGNDDDPSAEADDSADRACE